MLPDLYLHLLFYGARAGRLRGGGNVPGIITPEMSDEAPDERSIPATQDPPASTDDRARVAETLARLEAGVRQHRAELARVGERGGEKDFALQELERVEEPPCFSPRPVIGPLLVFLRKAGFHLFVKWWARPVLQGQNAFNQEASARIQELARALEDAELRLERLARRLDAREDGTATDTEIP